MPSLSRRGFLSSLFASVAAASAFDPERLLWVPGARTYFDIVRPPVALVTPSWITKEVAQQWERQLAFLDRIDRPWDTAIGDSITVRVPPRYRVA